MKRCRILHIIEKGYRPYSATKIGFIGTNPKDPRIHIVHGRLPEGMDVTIPVRMQNQANVTGLSRIIPRQTQSIPEKAVINRLSPMSENAAGFTDFVGFEKFRHGATPCRCLGGLPG